MNRRLRSPNGSDSPSKIDERLHRFLRPGALARLRDSKIIARSPRSVLMTAIPVPRPSPPSSPASPSRIEGFPCFASRIYGPRLLQRKKLVACKSVFFIPPSPEPFDPIIDLFAADLVAAH